MLRLLQRLMRTRRLILSLSALGGLPLCACATAPVVPPPLTLALDPTLEAPCAGPDLPGPGPVTSGALAAFSVEQEGALVVCEKKRAALVALIAAHNRDAVRAAR